VYEEKERIFLRNYEEMGVCGIKGCKNAVGWLIKGGRYIW